MSDETSEKAIETIDDWANCSVADCEYKCCKDLKSDKCFNHTTNTPFQQCNHAPEFLQTITNSLVECMRCGKIMKLSWDGGSLVLKDQ